MNIDQSQLIAGELLLKSKAANAVIRLDEYGLKRLKYDQLMSLCGFKGKEAIGGKVHLTNYRMIFKSHSVNRVRGAFSIYLPTIEDIQNTSTFMSKKLLIKTATQSFEFVVWGVPDLIAQVRMAADQLAADDSTRHRLLDLVRTNPDRYSGGMRVSPFIDRTARDGFDIAHALLEIAEDPISVTGVLNILELLKMATTHDE